MATWLVIWDPKRPLYVAFFMAGLFAQHCAFFIGKWYSFEDVRSRLAARLQTHARARADWGQ